MVVERDTRGRQSVRLNLVEAGKERSSPPAGNVGRAAGVDLYFKPPQSRALGRKVSQALQAILGEHQARIWSLKWTLPLIMTISSCPFGLELYALTARESSIGELLETPCRFG